MRTLTMALFEPIIQDELRQCAECFEDLYESGNADYDEGRFDFTEGLDQLINGLRSYWKWLPMVNGSTLQLAYCLHYRA